MTLHYLLFNAKCFGENWTIGVSSNPEDELLIENF